MASDDEPEVWPPPQSIAAQVGLPEDQAPRLTPDQEIRMRCVEAVARALSGAQYPIQSATIIVNMADEIERHVKGG